MTPAQLRAAFLQAAIRGELVPQDRADGTAADLLAHLRAERKRLEKQKKLRKQAPLSPLNPAEIPFPIPPSWQWVRLQEVAYMVGRRENQLLAKEVQATGKYPVISQGANFIDGYSNVEGKCVTDLPVVLFGDHTRNVKYLDFPFIIGADGVKLLKPFVINERYLYYWVLTTAQGLHDRGYARHFALLSKQLVPLPPLAEQERIVAKLGDCLALCEAYEARERLDADFGAAMRKSILQAAIQGKLVPQDRADGTAADLLAHLRAERKRLEKQKKLRKQAPLSPLNPAEIPFSIPASWQWVRLGEIVVDHGQTVPVKPFAYIDIGSIDNVHQRLSKEEKVVTPENAPSRARRIVERGDILYSTVRPYLHNACVVDKEFTHPPIASTGLAVMSCLRGVNNRFLFTYLMSPSFDAYANNSGNSKGVAYPAINDSALYQAPIPLPPLAEQERIVAKLEELLPLCTPQG